MNRSLEVRVRTGIALLFVGVAALELSLGTALAAQAPPPATQQTTAPDQPPAIPAPLPSTAPDASVPTPTPENQDQIENMPAYRHQPDQQQPSQPAQPSQPPAQAQPAAAPQTMPTPQQAPPPVVTSATPTPQTPYTAMPAYGTQEEAKVHIPGDQLGSAYIPVDSWVYPAMMRLYSMGYLDTMYLSMRPYTRRSALHILQASEDAILSSDDDQAQAILSALLNELTDEGITDHTIAESTRGAVYGVQSVYTRVMGVTGSIVQGSYYLGQTFFNDYVTAYLSQGSTTLPASPR